MMNMKIVAALALIVAVVNAESRALLSQRSNNSWPTDGMAPLTGGNAHSHLDPVQVSSMSAELTRQKNALGAQLSYIKARNDEYNFNSKVYAHNKAMFEAYRKAVVNNIKNVAEQTKNAVIQ